MVSPKRHHLGETQPEARECDGPSHKGTRVSFPLQQAEKIPLRCGRDSPGRDLDRGACFGKQRISSEGTGAQSRRLKSSAGRNHPLGKNRRSVWTVPVWSYPGAHFAVFPKELIKPC